jgi:hypothetical protein
MNPLSCLRHGFHLFTAHSAPRVGNQTTSKALHLTFSLLAEADPYPSAAEPNLSLLHGPNMELRESYVSLRPNARNT